MAQQLRASDALVGDAISVSPQHPQENSQQSLSPVPGCLTTSSGLHENTHGIHKDSQANYPHKIKPNFLILNLKHTISQTFQIRDHHNINKADINKAHQ